MPTGHWGFRSPRLLPLCIALAWTGTAVGQPCAEEVPYRNTVFLLDCHGRLFGPNDLGPFRQRIFERYLQEAPEGKLRVTRAQSADPARVWGHLTAEEKATFVAITGALGTLAESGGVKLNEWVIRLDAVHGEMDFGTGRTFGSNQAFRLYAQISDAARRHLLAGAGTFQNVCTKLALAYDGLGSRHPSYCQPPRRFEVERKTDLLPNLQFNFNRSNQCADIDIDYDRGVAHLGRDNSNVLHEQHVEEFHRAYCDPGLRRKP